MSIERAIEICRRWQDVPNWNALNRAVHNHAKYLQKAADDAAVIHRTERRIANLTAQLAGKLPKGDRSILKAELAAEEAYRNGEGFRLFEESEARNEKLAEESHSTALSFLAELQELEHIVRQHAPQFLGDMPAASPFAEPVNGGECVQMMRRLEGGLLSLKAGQPGHSRKKTPPPDDVAEVVRRMALKKWRGKYPIDVCREYTREKNPKADSDTINREAESLKRKLNRHKN